MEYGEREALLRSGFASVYALTGKVIYSGLASTIYLGVERDSGLQTSIKVMLKSKMISDAEHRMAHLEIELHGAVSAHPNVVRLLAAEVTPEAFILATPYAPQGDLWVLTKYGATYCEAEVRNCGAQMLVALHHIHRVCDIVHGDIKPHNFLCFEVDGRYVVQLCDFGLAEKPPTPGGVIAFAGMRGTSGWFSPEMVLGLDHGFPGDLFASGLILFRMLAGYAPFDPVTNFSSPVEFEDPYWCHITEPCKELLLRLLDTNAATRGTAEEVCQHTWLNGPPPAEASAEQLKELCKYGPPPRSDVLFWPAAEVPGRERQSSYADLDALQV